MSQQLLTRTVKSGQLDVSVWKISQIDLCTEATDLVAWPQKPWDIWVFNYDRFPTFPQWHLSGIRNSMAIKLTGHQSKVIIQYIKWWYFILVGLWTFWSPPTNDINGIKFGPISQFFPTAFHDLACRCGPGGTAIDAFARMPWGPIRTGLAVLTYGQTHSLKRTLIWLKNT